jgi:catalase
VLFDAIAMILAPEVAQKLTRDAAAVGFVADAYAHLKAIGHCGGSKVLLERAGVDPDDGVIPYEQLPEAAKHRYWNREPQVRNLA